MAVASYLYEKGFLIGSDRDWYHGELTTEEAEQALKASGCDCYLIRQSQGVLVLSHIHGGRFTHTKIVGGERGFSLADSPQPFSELPELISHYHTTFELGKACTRQHGKPIGTVLSQFMMRVYPEIKQGEHLHKDTEGDGEGE
jgi:hypothetical protein